jgi:hypothetical protein
MRVRRELTIQASGGSPDNRRVRGVERRVLSGEPVAWELGWQPAEGPVDH